MASSVAEWGASVGSFQRFNLRELLQRRFNAAAPLAESKNIRLSVSLDPELPERIFGDPEALNYIIAELLISAIRSTANGEIGLSLKHLGCTFSIVVCNTGIGTAPRRDIPGQAGKTGPLSPVPAISAMSTPGLSTVRRLAQLMGGSVMIFSQVGEGTSVTVLLPLPDELDPDSPTQPTRP